MSDVQDEIVLLAQRVAAGFTESDWKVLARRTGFDRQVRNHPRLLRSLQFKDDDYPGHCLDMLSSIASADPANARIIESLLEGHETRFFDQAGRFQRGEQIGEGGYGQVFRETDKVIGLLFARKELRPSAFVTDDAIARFLREARILFRLRHPNVIGVYDVGSDGRNAYIRMELFEGKHLDTVGQLAPHKARTLIAMIADGVAHAHSQGVLHRDLKPSNVLVLGEDVRVIDFGLGAFIEADLSNRLTRPDEKVAGGSYCAPELKDDPSLLDPRSDVFSIGALWYKVVTGRDPTAADRAELLKEVGDMPEVDRNLVLACLGPLRFRPTSEALCSELRELTSHLPPVRKQANELSSNEARVLSGFAMCYPDHGETVWVSSLRKAVGTRLGLRPDLAFGLALRSLEDRGYVSKLVDDEAATRWTVEPAGKNWLANNAPVLWDLEAEDSDIPF